MIIKLYFCNIIIETATSNKLKIKILDKLYKERSNTTKIKNIINISYSYDNILKILNDNDYKYVCTSLL